MFVLVKAGLENINNFTTTLRIIPSANFKFDRLGGSLPISRNADEIPVLG
jgi:hypothetical protein